MQILKDLSWGLFWFIATLVLMVGAAYLWVFGYSVAINPGGDGAYYEAYAQRASPVVAVVTAFPVFYLMGRAICRQTAHPLGVAAGVLLVNLLMEAAVLATLDETLSYVLPFSVAAGVLKILGTCMACRHLYRADADASI